MSLVCLAAPRERVLRSPEHPGAPLERPAMPPERTDTPPERTDVPRNALMYPRNTRFARLGEFSAFQGACLPLPGVDALALGAGVKRPQGTGSGQKPSREVAAADSGRGSAEGLPVTCPPLPGPFVNVP